MRSHEYRRRGMFDFRSLERGSETHFQNDLLLFFQ